MTFLSWSLTRSSVTIVPPLVTADALIPRIARTYPQHVVDKCRNWLIYASSRCFGSTSRPFFARPWSIGGVGFGQASGLGTAQVPGAPIGLVLFPALHDRLFSREVGLYLEALFGYLGERFEEHGGGVGAESGEVVRIEAFPLLQA